jgi:hypothetical protein
MASQPHSVEERISDLAATAFTTEDEREFPERDLRTLESRP